MPKSTANTATLAIAILAAYLLYRALLPSPIPGIPYSKEASHSLLGDMPAMIHHANKTGEMYDWLAAQNIKHASPVVQVFGRGPLSKPWLVISDFRETQDILLRRVKEFDRSAFTANLLGGVIPEHHSRWQTDEEYKSRKRLVGDILTPSFLGKAAAPLLHESTMRMTALWREKARLARGRPFSALKDISHCALDAVLGFTFGPGMEGLSATQPNVDFLSAMSSLPVSGETESIDLNQPVVFSHAPPSSVIEALFKISDSLEVAMKSAFPVLAHWLLRQRHALKTAIQIKEDLLKNQVDLAAARVQSTSEDQVVRCAIDEMNKKREADMNPQLYGFTLGGHESTSNANQWALKTLARHQHQQTKLRASLRDALPDAVISKRVPTPQEIMQARCPYLDASIEELFRVSLTAPMCVRSATQDTQILGYAVPKDTVVFQVWNRADYTMPGFLVDDALRTPGARAAVKGGGGGAGTGVGHWGDVSGIDAATYAPERWLVRSEDGTRDIFDATRGRNMIFSMGPRGCYGRKLAYVQFRMLVVLVLWNFHVEELPQELNTTGAYDKLTREPHDCFVRLTALPL
ncbi:hypothetical protein SGCOL_006394 [Colletotrichum sp. CLE4]